VVSGVSWDSRRKRWTAHVRVDGGDGKRKTRCLGSFVDEVDAAMAYDQAAREHHGNKARLNFPDRPPQPQAALNLTTPRKASSQYRGEGRCT
jgi:hypothetical protein